MRWIRHWIGRSTVHRLFPAATLNAIQIAIAAGEQDHLGEVCFAIEGGLPWRQLIDFDGARSHAEAAFGRLGVWNTADNTGVLVYVLLAEQAIEIVADRGIAAKVDQGEWQAICATLGHAYRAGDHCKGTVAAINAIHRLLTTHFPANGHPNPDELPNRPVIL